VSLYFVIAWLPSVLLACLTFFIRDVSSSPLGGVYGVQAIFLHCNQLIVPLLFGWLMRDQMIGALAGAASGELSNKVVAPEHPL